MNQFQDTFHFPLIEQAVRLLMVCQSVLVLVNHASFFLFLALRIPWVLFQSWLCVCECPWSMLQSLCTIISQCLKITKSVSFFNFGAKLYFSFITFTKNNSFFNIIYEVKIFEFSRQKSTLEFWTFLAKIQKNSENSNIWKEDFLPENSYKTFLLLFKRCAFWRENSNTKKIEDFLSEN